MAEYKNPNQKGSGFDLTSLITTVGIFLLFYFGMRHFFPPPATPAQQQAVQNAQPTPQAAAAANAVATANAPAVPAAAAKTAQAESQTVVENDNYRITFSNRGAQVTSWILKKYKADTNGTQLDLVHVETASKFGYPLSLYTYDAGLTSRLAQALYIPSATGSLSAPNSLSFEYADGNGLVVHKTFTFDQSYVIHADTQVTQNGAPVRALLSWPVGPNALTKGRSGLGFTSSGTSTEQFDHMQNDKDAHVAASKVAGGETLNGPFDWAGVSDVYFGVAFLPDTPQSASVVSLSNPVDVAISEKKTIAMPVLGLAQGDVSGHTQTRVFVGPKLLDLLNSIHANGSAGQSGPSLGKMIDFGFFGPIAKFLFLSLYYVEKHITGNWGWAIIVLTLIINLLLVPLRYSTMKSALKMQRIQPQMDQIKAKFAKYKMSDPRRADMNTEIMALQKANGVNMFGGCLPNLIQLPLLIAFITVLPKVTELHLLHWGWLPDMTAPDPLHILPILVILTSFLTSYFMPSPGVDPQQQKMMAFMMPAFFGVFFWSYPSGPSLYYATSNLLMIAQQLAMNRTSLGQEMRDVAAKRARRKAGAGVIQGKR